MNTALPDAVDSIVDLIGNTPMVRLSSIEKRAGGGVEIWGKCEFANPGGSVKDRAASLMVREALEGGRLGKPAGGGPEKILIDSTSGNTGVAYSMLGAALGFPVHLVMPANVSAARKQITSAYGTKIIYSSELEGSDGAIRLVRKLVAESPDKYFYPDQYSNSANPRAHYQGTGAEIIRDLGDRITHFVAGIGTTGTVMGTGRRLKEHRQDIQVIAVEPDDALHGLEGLKHLPSSLVPGIWNPDGIVDQMLPMPTDEAWDISDEVCAKDGLFIGHSAGAAVAAALRIAKKHGPGACIVCILPDRGDRYFRPLKWEKQYVW